MSDSSVRFKGVNGDLLLSLDWAEPVEVLLEQLDVQLKSSDNFFHGSRVILELGAKALELTDLQTFQDLLARYGMMLHSLRGALPEEAVSSALEPSVASRTLGTLRVPTDQESASEQVLAETTEATTRGLSRARTAARVLRMNARAPSSDARGQAKTLLVKRTLRSGQVLNYAGSIILIGDVNPGAEVVAGHDIVVWGSLRGMACAGGSGDAQAGIYALHMAPSQLRIADYITRSPRESLLAADGHDLQPEVARIEGETIVVEPWHTKKALPAKVLSKVSDVDISEKDSKG